VSQRQTYSTEHSQGFLWAPKDGIWHHETMRGVKKGDAVIQYNGALVGIGIASKDCYSSTQPSNNAFNKWDPEGYRVDVDQFHFVTPVKKESVIKDFLRCQPASHSPLNKFGNVNQGYLFEANEEMVNIVLNKALEINQAPDQVEIVKKIRDALKLPENHGPTMDDKRDLEEKEGKMQKIFFGAPGTGKSYKVNLLLPNESVWNLTGEERKNLFMNSEVAKKEHYADVLSTETKFGGNIWNIDELVLLEEKLSEVNSEDNVKNPEHSALRAYINFLKEYKFEQKVFRTTFHPDYDYAQFVGAYKPQKTHNSSILNKNELIECLKEMKKDRYPIHKFSALYFDSLLKLSNAELMEIIKETDTPDSMNVELKKGIAVGEYLKSKKTSSSITYSFVPQVFAKAYAAAWKLQLTGAAEANVFLVIEEINRGNCAQIFGDIFQLLDRDGDGFSQYSIDADCDFAEWLETDEKGLKFVWDKYKETVGEGKLKLPPNLNILATMNTSDQSLFPMDSAFKRRFDWEYVPISFDGKDAANFQIDIDGIQYSWQKFVETVNEKILTLTESEDKQLGEFFIKPDNGNVISKDRFLGKVMFYLWNEICKDEHKNGSFFRVKDKDGKEDYFTFQGLYRNKDLLKQFMEELLNGNP